MFAIIQTGGKQHKVSQGDVIEVERLKAKEGETIKTENVLLVDDSGKTTVGAPLVKGATVSMKIVSHFRGEKLKVYKMKAKKRYQKTQGHRQETTKIEITAINFGTKTAPKAEKAPAAKKEAPKKKEEAK